MTDNALLSFNRSDSYSVTSAISGTGSLRQIGGGTLTLSGTNSYTGTTTVASGTLKLANVSALGSTAGGTIVQNSGALDLNGLSIGTEALTINGSGGGNGALVNNNASTAAVYNGAVTLGSSAAMGGLGDTTLSGSLNYGTFALTKNGTGTLALTGSQSWGNGASATVQSGTLTYQQASGAMTSVATGTATLNIAASAVVNVNASNHDPFTDDTTSTNHVQIVNDAAGGLKLTAGISAVAGVSGTGSTSVLDGATLITSYICQGGLWIGSGAKLIIAPIIEAGDPLDLQADGLSPLGSSSLSAGDLTALPGSATDAGAAQNGSVNSSDLPSSTGINALNSVPEPSTNLLLLLGALSGIARFICKRKA